MKRRRIHVVAIEDDSADAALLERYLKGVDEWECEVEHIDDAQAGVALLAVSRPNVVVLDHMLGKDVGLDVIDKIRDVGYDGPIIFLTGRGDEEIAVQAWKAGVDDYLPKRALSTSSLKRSISNTMEKHELRQAIEKHRRRLQDSNDRLKRKNQEIQTFYHGVSHELKTPLTSAREFVSIVLDEISGPLDDQQREYLTIAKEAIDQMAYYIGDLLDSTRLETGKLKLEMQKLDVAELAERVIDSLTPRAEREGIALVKIMEVGVPPVSADAKRLRQVISNLISNAIKFTDEGGTVKVCVGRGTDGDTIEVAVSDTGRGIAPEHRDRIFDRLYQVNGDDATLTEGLGLGLNICLGIVELHGGKIKVDSEPGRGSTFTFWLPCEPAKDGSKLSPA